MNPYLIVLLILLIVFIGFSINSNKYFKQQKRKCQKYSYYKLRDEIIWDIVENGKNDENIEIYKYSNFLIERLRNLNFSFYSEALSKLFNNIIEIAFKDNNQSAEDIINKIKNKEISKYRKKLGELIFNTAYDNSTLLRFSMSKWGINLLFWISSLKALKRFFDSHPELFVKQRKNLQVAKEYSVLNYCFSSQ